jgi:hypothetical protein
MRDLRYPELKKFSIDRPGKYVLTEDQIQSAQFRTGNGWVSPTGGQMLYIRCGSVELDLQGHTFGADLAMAGIALLPTYNSDRKKEHPKESPPEALDNRFVTVRNGTVDFVRGKRTGPAITFADYWHAHNRLTVGRPVVGRTPQSSIRYEPNHYHFERLKVLAHDVAMTVEGSYTIIRDCVIESADDAAVFIAGDHVLIENCEIRLRRPRIRSEKPRAAIVLRDGSNAVIRNNRIRVDYGGDSDDQTHGILVRDGATEVLIEGNTFINVRGNPVTLTEGATASVRENKQEKRWSW